MKKTMISFVVVVACLYLALAGFMYVMQRNFQYFSQQSVRTGFEDPAQFGLDGFAVESIQTADGETLKSWLALPPEPDAPLILYMHGNAGTLGDRAERFGVFHRDGFGVLVLSWRGYGGSTGSPTETGLVEDGRAAMEFLQQKGVPASRIILFGESLGGGVATQLAANPDTRPLAVVLEAPFTSAADVARKRYWFLPVGLLMKDQFRSIDFAPKVTVPVFVFHGTNDWVVPYAQGKRLHEAFAGPKEFLSMQGNGHIDPLTEVSWGAIKDFLRAHGVAPE
ncbi:MAG: alpha/beta hydrolase [Anderseniella sp.]